MNTLLLTVGPGAPGTQVIDGLTLPGNLVDNRATQATYIDSTGLMQIAPPNAPRVDWSGGAPELLSEGASENLIADSIAGVPVAGEGFAVEAVGVGLMPSLQAGSAIYKVTLTAAQGTLAALFFYVDPLSPGAFLTASAYVLLPQSWSGSALSVGPFVTGAFGQPNADLTKRGMWQRLWIADKGAPSFLQITSQDTAVGDYFYITCPQVEPGQSPTSYIPTSGAPATRAADQILYPAGAAWDLCLDANGNIAMATAPYALAQDAASAIKTFLGEVWYDTTQGAPYLQQILGKFPSLGLVKSKLVAAAMTVPGVASAKVFVTGVSNRALNGQVQVTDATGNISAASF